MTAHFSVWSDPTAIRMTASLFIQLQSNRNVSLDLILALGFALTPGGINMRRRSGRQR